MTGNDACTEPRVSGRSNARTLTTPIDPAEYESLGATLRDRVDGEVRFDSYARVLYASDGSIYQAQPAGVVCPKTVADVQATVETATEHSVPLLPRGTGSSLAGQAVGHGCIVLDFTKHMDEIVDIDPVARRATVEPGCVQDHLDDQLSPHGLKFAPDPASSNRATIGGGIGNNSTGAHSVRYGITDAYTEELRVVLADGTLIHTREIVLDGEEYEAIIERGGTEAILYATVRELVNSHSAEIDRRYPSLKRSVSGYNLQKVIYENEAGDRVINLSKLFVGAEGTLGIVVEACVSLVTCPEETALALYCFDDLRAALQAVPRALEHPVSAVELMDEEVFRLARESEGYAEYARDVPTETAAALLLEWDDELVDDFDAAIGEVTSRFVDDGRAFAVREAHSDEAQQRLWKLRKAAIPLLMSLEGDPKPYPFIEDATVPPEALAEYVEQFESILNAHDTEAAYFAHAGSGTLHIRPILNLKAESGVETMHSITDDVTDLVVEHDGSFSGEHGDGLARTEYNPKLYGQALWTAFKRLKTAFDPDWLLNPGTVVYREDSTDPGPPSDRGVGADMRANLRYGPEYQSIEPQTQLDFDEEGGFSHLVELCNGCGTCRQTTGDVMCPTYRASKDEIQSTRGRANMLRAAISGELPEETLQSDRFHREVLDLCIGCKGCKSDCPTGVDMAKLKAELKHQHHEQTGVGLRSKLFGHIDTLAAIGSATAPLSTIGPRLPGSRLLLEKLFGIARNRELPRFTRESLTAWFDSRDTSSIPAADATERVVLFPDTYTNYSYPAVGKAAIKVLEAAGVHVRIGDELTPSGRAAFSMGLLDLASDRAQTNVQTLAPRVADGWTVVFVEPSDAVMFQDEYLDLLEGDRVRAVSEAAEGIMEFLDRRRLIEALPLATPTETLAYHGHCNQTAIHRDHHAVGVLRRAGYEVDPLDSSCCGMAGSFGYEAEHYELSMAIGQQLFDLIGESDGEVVTAPGGSCRSQLSTYTDEDRPPHPIETIARLLQ